MYLQPASNSHEIKEFLLLQGNTIIVTVYKMGSFATEHHTIL